MLVLGIDTSSKWGSIALLREEEVVFEISLKLAKGNSEYLIGLLNDLFVRTQQKVADLDLIVVGSGPGSYTGIRVGLAVAQGLAAGLEIPLVGVNTLRIMAENVKHLAPYVVALIDARHSEVYAALYERINDSLSEIMAPAPLPIDILAQKLTEFPEAILCGDGSKAYQSTWEKLTNLQIASNQLDRPLASQAIMVVKNEKLFVNPQTQKIVPFYLKKVAAEVRRSGSVPNGN